MKLERKLGKRGDYEQGFHKLLYMIFQKEVEVQELQICQNWED